MRLAVPLVVTVALVAAAGAARADVDEDRRTAARLFKEGREAVAAGDLEGGCGKFAASLKLDAAIGTRLNLADCLERRGQLVAAFYLYDEAAIEAARTSKEGRESFARRRADALAGKLFVLRLEPEDPAPGTTISVAGTAIPPESWTAPRVVMPGSISIVVTAPGRRPYRTRIDAGSGGNRTVELPPLEPLAAGERDPTTASGDDQVTGVAASIERAPAHPTRRLGLVVGGAGAGLLATSLVMGLVARGRYEDADCGPEHGHAPGECSVEGQRDADSARTLADVGTGVAIVGVAAVGVGVWLFLRGGAPRDTGGVTVVPTVSDDGVGVVLTLER